MKKNGYTLAEVLISLGIIGVVSALIISMLNFTSASKITATKLINAVNTFNNVSTAMLAKKGYTSVTDGWFGSNGFNYEAYINDLSDQMKSTHTTALLLQPVYAEDEEIQGGVPSSCYWVNTGECINNSQTQIKVCNDTTVESRTVSCSSFDPDDFDYEIEPNGNGSQQQLHVPLINNLNSVVYNESQLETQSHTTSNGTNYLFLFDENFDENATSVPSKQMIGYVWIDLDGDNDNSANIIGYDRFLFSWFNDGTIRPVGSKNWDGSMNSNTWDQRNGSTTRCGADSNPKSNQENAKYCAGSIFENNKVIYKL